MNIRSKYKIKYQIGHGISSNLFLLTTKDNNINIRNNTLIDNLNINDIYKNPDVLYKWEKKNNYFKLIEMNKVIDNNVKYNKYVVKIISNKNFNYDNEVKVYMIMDHPNIIKPIEYFKINNEYHIILPFYPYLDLYEYLRINTLNINQIKSIMYDIGDALKYCHSLNIIHCDIKPENITLTDNFKPILIDFGFVLHNNTINYIRGTDNFLAPEIISNNNYSSKSDIWAYGITIYELLIHNSPFEDFTELLTMSKIINYDIEFPESLDDLSLDLLKKLITYNPFERPSWDEILNHDWFKS